MSILDAIVAFFMSLFGYKTVTVNCNPIILKTSTHGDPVAGQAVTMTYQQKNGSVNTDGSTVTNASGAGSISTKLKLKKGTWTITLKFAGSPLYGSSTYSTTVTV